MKKNISLIVGLSLPILMIIIVAISIYLPQLFTHPKYGFIYVNNNRNYYTYSYHFEVNQDKIATTSNAIYNNSTPLYKNIPMPPPTLSPNQNTKIPTLYQYDPLTNLSHEITVAEANSHMLDTNQTSPDGFILQRGESNGSIFNLFGGYSRDAYNTWYLVKGSQTKKVNVSLPTNDAYSGSDIQLLAWITN